MIIEPTYNMDLVKEILMIPEIWDRAAEDGADKDSYYPGFDTMCGWLLCKDDEDMIGIIYIHNDNTRSIKMHPYVLPDQRGKGKQMMLSFFNWLITNCPQVEKLLITIPFCYKRVYKFAQKIGFIDEGVNRQSYYKKGELYDQWNLGLTRDEIAGLI